MRHITIAVQYAEHPVVKLWLPVTMDEVYTFTRRGLDASTAYSHPTYTNFKRFRVETSANVK
jgi:hypothetical protein